MVEGEEREGARCSSRWLRTIVDCWLVGFIRVEMRQSVLILRLPETTLAA